MPPQTAEVLKFRPIDPWRWLPGLVLLIGLLLSAVLYQLSVNSLQERRRAYFDFRVREAMELIEGRMRTYQQVLRGVSGLFDTHAKVDRAQFHRYVERQALAEFFAGIQGVGFAQRVDPQDLARHTAAIRAEGFPSYAVQPPGQRPLYSAIVYLEPFSGRNLRAFGFDMYSEPVRREAMQRSVDTGRMALSGKVRLQQESGVQEQAGFLIYQAIYRKDQPASNEQERREQLIGWVYAPFRMNDFLRGLFGEQGDDLVLDIYDGEQGTPDALMHNDSAEHLDVRDGYDALQTLRMMGHTWTLHFRSSNSMLLRVDSRLPLLTFASGALLSLLLAALVSALVTGRARALSTARRMNEELVQERARLTAIIAGTHVGTWEWNVQTGQTVFNQEWAELLGYTLEELQPTSIQTWMRLSHPDDLEHSGKRLQQHFSGESAYYECEARMRHKEGHWVWVLDRGKVATRTADGAPLMMYGTHQDITHRKVQEETFRRSAQHDQLTGLPNRALLADRLQQALLAARREKARLTLMFIDIDGFKGVNDAHGHDAGDLVLRSIARRIKSCIRASDTLARIGGDEFVLLLPDQRDGPSALALAAKIRGEACRPITLSQGNSVQLSLSIGIALYPDHGETPGELTEHADRAMYKAKRSGKNAAMLFETGWGAAETIPGDPG